MGYRALKSPIHRFGGKYFLRNWLANKVPEHVLYCEPFVGAGHLLFSKTPSQVEILNDTDNHLINFFKVIREPEKCEMLIDRLRYMPYSRSLWQEIRTSWKLGNIPGHEIERALHWFYLNRACFSGDIMRGGFAMPSVTGRNTAQSFKNAVDTFKDVALRLRNVTIECLDYKDCIQKYDSPDSLFYCDPPYLNAEHYYGKDSFGHDDHRTLADLLHMVKGRVMTSHYQNSLYDELYRGWHRYEYASFKGSHKSAGGAKPKTVEVLYCNFESEGVNR